MMNSRKRLDSGYSLIEIMVVMAITSVILIIMMESLDEAARTSLFVESHNDMPVFSQKIVNIIQTEILESRFILDGNAATIGPGYLAKIQASLPASDPLLPGSQLPIINITGVFVPDPTAPVARYAGNSMLLVRQISPVTVRYTVPAVVGPPAVASYQADYQADRYRFEYFYLTRRTSRSFAASGSYLDVVQARSGLYADYFQLNNLSLTNSQRLEINNGLIAKGIAKAWNPNQAVTNTGATSAFWTLNPSGTLFTAVAAGSVTIPVLSVKSLMPALAGGRISGSMTYSVAFRRTATTTYPLRHAVPLYVTSGITANFPSGLEFLVAGPAGSRRVLTRVVLMAHYGTRRFDSMEAFNITSSTM